MLLKKFSNALIVALDRFGKGRDLRYQSLNHHRRSQQHRAIFGQRLSLFNVFHQLLEFVVAPVSLNFVKLADRRSRCPLQFLQGRPTFKESTSPGSVQISKPVQGLGKVGLQSCRQLIGQRGPFIDQSPPAFGQQLNAAGENIIGNPDAEMLAMGHQNLQQQVGIGRIVLGAAGIKRLAHFGHRLGIDGVKTQKLDVHEGVDEGSATLFDGNSDPFAGKPAPQLLNPALQSLWSLVQSEPLPLIAAGLLQRADMLLVGPIQSYECGDFDILFRHQTQLSPYVSQAVEDLPEESAHKPYSRVFERHHLSICPFSPSDRVRKSPEIVDTLGWLIRNAIRPVFHMGKLAKEKEKRTKKEKENGPWKMPQLWKSAGESVGLRPLFLAADSHSCLEKPRQKMARLSHIYHRPGGDDSTNFQI